MDYDRLKGPQRTERAGNPESLVLSAPTSDGHNRKYLEAEGDEVSVLVTDAETTMVLLSGALREWLT